MIFKRVEIHSDETGLVRVIRNADVQTTSSGYGSCWIVVFEGTEVARLTTFDDGPVCIFNTPFVCVAGILTGEDARGKQDYVYGEWRLYIE